MKTFQVMFRKGSNSGIFYRDTIKADEFQINISGALYFKKDNIIFYAFNNLEWIEVKEIN